MTNHAPEGPGREEKRKEEPSPVIIGVDTGGTFTDFVFREGGRWGVYKVLSTPADPSQAVLEGLSRICEGRGRRIVHGSTVATNAILERKGARTALVTNRGFEDVVEIGRQQRSRLYDLAYRKEPPLVPPGRRFGVIGRVLPTGEVLEPLDEECARNVVREILSRDFASVAVCLLFSYANPAHEDRLESLLTEAGLRVSVSHDILAEFREYERTSTTLINAYVSPKMEEYIGRLIEGLGPRETLSIMQSNGGSISAQTAMRESVRTILSGPAGGAVGAFEIGRAAGYPGVISFDMGGTSTDVSLIDGQLSLTTESTLSGFPIKVPMIDIQTVGAGGGSIAALDEGGSLRVGPESAGADPGPVCYGKGERITVTDANLFLGRLIPEHFLGGGMRLREDRLSPRMHRMAQDAGISALELAEGILSVANAAMERAIRVISVERGYDPREFTLLSFGGAGGMHAAFLAQLLRIPRVLVPRNPGIFSAIGMLMADVIKDYSLTVMTPEEEASPDRFGRAFGELQARGAQDLAAEGVPGDRVVFQRYLDMRYAGQSYEIVVPYEGDFIRNFHRAHEKTYGHKHEEKGVEVVNVRLRALGLPEKPPLETLPPGPASPDATALLGEKEVVFDHEPQRARIYRREALARGNRFPGPAVVVEYSSTVVIPPFARALVDAYGNLVLEIEED